MLSRKQNLLFAIVFVAGVAAWLKAGEDKKPVYYHNTNLHSHKALVYDTLIPLMHDTDANIVIMWDVNVEANRRTARAFYYKDKTGQIKEDPLVGSYSALFNSDSARSSDLAALMRNQVRCAKNLKSTHIGVRALELNGNWLCRANVPPQFDIFKGYITVFFSDENYTHNANLPDRLMAATARLSVVYQRPSNWQRLKNWLSE
jgi:hypothetical protein